MYFDSGRQADLKLLETRLKEASTPEEREKYKRLIDTIKRQAEDPRLNKERELLMEARRQGDQKGGDKLEAKIDTEYRV